MMFITVNGSEQKTDIKTVMQLHDLSFSDYDVTILNGYQISEDFELKNGDQIYFGKKNVFPNSKELEMLMAARHTPFIQDRMRNATVGIAGLGGLGSNIAAMLSRMGVGHLIIADFDTVEPTNLNRQNYYVDNIGERKTDATADILHNINPFITITKHFIRITADNAADIFGECSVVCEAFDSPSEKAMLVNTILEKCPYTVVVAGSGMAGTDDSNLIRTEKKFKNLYVCGDNTNSAKPGMGLMAPRVNICAGHMANAVVRILMD
ncbi:MAG: sulfur carrier protein ThiS adenylyltransferase ThiF [Candidatus Methanomethylophilaceae archaeon]|nr:sulfur carrier protein ThiS adenylyltransferase ThiF [Candidatus Methanomethylophilaceae archaeon]